MYLPIIILRNHIHFNSKSVEIINISFIFKIFSIINVPIYCLLIKCFINKMLAIYSVLINFNIQNTFFCHNLFSYESSDIPDVSGGKASAGGSLTSAKRLSSFMHCKVHWSKCCCFFGGLHAILRFGDSFKVVIQPLLKE